MSQRLPHSVLNIATRTVSHTLHDSHDLEGTSWPRQISSIWKMSRTTLERGLPAAQRFSLSELQYGNNRLHEDGTPSASSRPAFR